MGEFDPKADTLSISEGGRVARAGPPPSTCLFLKARARAI